MSFLLEDRADADATTAPLNLPATAVARIVANEAGVASGMAAAARCFTLLAPASATEEVAEGAILEPGSEVVAATGPPAALLGAERVALNLLGRACGIATATAAVVRALAGTGVTVLDTRKTAPGLRWLDRDAVVAGGGANHREDLAAMVLLKENHLALAGSIGAAVSAVRAGPNGHLPVEVEVEDRGELAAALAAGVERVMLDDWPRADLAAGIDAARQAGVETEVSGGLDAAAAREVALLGPDFVSLGGLTTGARALDLSMAISTA